MDGRALALGAIALLTGAKAIATGSRTAEPVELPKAGPVERASVVAGELKLQGRPKEVDLRSKTRQAYRWITNEAIVVPYFDMHFGAAPIPAGTQVPALSGDSESYSAYVLLPMLTLLTGRRALLLGGPGRGKTTSALVLAMIAGMKKEQLRSSIVRGHPQLMVSDLLGTPLPKSLVGAETIKDIEVSWRSWITNARVKIIDEYNRIPTKTQSALLSLMAEGYAEMFDKYVQTGRERPEGGRRSQDAWFLTANDDQGGGTFAVIEALKDRIDVVVRATPFNPAFSDRLVERMSRGTSPEEMVPDDIIFDNEELDAIYDDILKVDVPAGLVDKIGFLMGSLEFCLKASPIFEYKIKDTLKLSGTTVAAICNETCPLDKKVHLCTQTENGISVRGLQAILHYAKALAWFRGKAVVTWDDVRQIVPWILHDKLVSNPRSQFFQDPNNAELLRDKVAWIGQLVDKSAGLYPKYEPLRERTKKVLSAARLGGFQSRAEIDARMNEIHSLYGEISKGEFSGFVYDLLTSLRMTYARYTEFLKGSQNRGSRVGPALKAFRFQTPSTSRWNYKLVVFAPGKKAAMDYVKGQGMSSLHHRELVFVGEGEPSEKEKDRWTAARVGSSSRGSAGKDALLSIRNEAGRRFNVRIVRPGEGYGLSDRVVYPKGVFETKRAALGDVLVEFYDATHVSAKEPRGQFVSRYYLSTLKERSGGINLQGGEPVWEISAENRDEAIAYAEGR